MAFLPLNRRGFLGFWGGATAAGLGQAQAQQKQAPVIAILGSGAPDAASSRQQMQLLGAGMRELGLIEGRDYVFEIRWAGSDASRFSALSADLLTYRPSAVVVSTNLAAQTVQKLLSTVPIVGTGLNAPIETGLVASLAHPGGSITGVSTMAEDVLIKLVEIMREALPEVRRFAVMTNPTNPSNQLMVDAVLRHAVERRLAVTTVRVSSPENLDAAFAEIALQPCGALFVLTDNSLSGLAEKIISRAMAQRVPTFGNFSDAFARAGALISYSRDPKEAFQGVARLLKKILNGANPAELPMEQPTKFSLFVNLKTAKALGIEIPPILLTRADRVIE